MKGRDKAGKHDWESLKFPRTPFPGRLIGSSQSMGGVLTGPDGRAVHVNCGGLDENIFEYTRDCFAMTLGKGEKVQLTTAAKLPYMLEGRRKLEQSIPHAGSRGQVHSSGTLSAQQHSLGWSGGVLTTFRWCIWDGHSLCLPAVECISEVRASDLLDCGPLIRLRYRLLLPLK